MPSALDNSVLPPRVVVFSKLERRILSAGKPKDGNARARWALIETSPDGVNVEFRRVEYDVEKAAQAVLDSDLPDEFAAQLRDARGYLPVPA